MKENGSQLKAGALLSYLNLALSSVIPFLYTPIMLRMLGDHEYGLYSLSSTAIGYLSLLSFGFGSTILRYLTLYRAKGDRENEQKIFGFFILLYTFVGLLVMIGGVIISQNVEPIFHRGLTGDELAKMKVLTLIMAFNSALSFPMSVFSSAIMAHERYIYRKLVDMFLTVAAPAANLIALYMGYASVGMAISSVIVHTVVLPLNMYYCYRVLRIRPVFAAIPKSLVREMIGFSAFIFLATLVDMLFWSTDKMLLGMFAGSMAVAVYNIGSTFNTMVMSLSTSISSVLMPRVTAMVAQETDEKKLSDLFIKVGRIQYFIVALIISGFAVFGQAFIRIWVGESYKNAYWIAVLTMFPLCVPLIQNTGITIINAKNRHQFRSVVYLLIAIANVISTYLVIPTMGGIGAAVCSGVSYILGQGIIMNFYYWKKIHLDIPLFWKNILKMSPIPAAMLVSGLLIFRVLHISSWAVFFLAVGIYSLLYLVLMYVFSLNSYEKDLITGVLRRVQRN